jgi:hypothetical protein
MNLFIAARDALRPGGERVGGFAHVISTAVSIELQRCERDCRGPSRGRVGC